MDVPEISLIPVKRARVRGGSFHSRVRTRGGQQNGGRSISTPKSTKAELKATKQRDLERKWLEEDHEPVVPEFTANAGPQVDIPDNPSVLDYFHIFITDEFYNLLVEQTNLYAEQYIAANPVLKTHSLSNSLDSNIK